MGGVSQVSLALVIRSSYFEFSIRPSTRLSSAGSKAVRDMLRDAFLSAVRVLPSSSLMSLIWNFRSAIHARAALRTAYSAKSATPSSLVRTKLSTALTLVIRLSSVARAIRKSRIPR